MATDGFTDAQKEMMMIAKESRTGMQISGSLTLWSGLGLTPVYLIFQFLVYSLLELVPVLLAILGAILFLSGRLNQDTLEKHFGMQCQKGKSNDNPTVLQFIKNTDILRQVGLMWFDDARGELSKECYWRLAINWWH